MPLTPRFRTPRRVRVVLSTPIVMSFLSVWKAAAFAIAQLGVAAFFIAGVTQPLLGDAAVRWVVAAAIISAFVRAIDIESWAVLIPGGTTGRLQEAFGSRVGRFGSAAVLTERLTFAAAAALIIGHYVADALVPALRAPFVKSATSEELAAFVAIAVVGLLWIRARMGLRWSRDAMAISIATGVALLLALIAWSAFSLTGASWRASFVAAPPALAWTRWPVLNSALLVLLGCGAVLPVLGSGDVLLRTAGELAPPRIGALRRTAAVVVLFTLIVTAFGTFVYTALVPAPERATFAAIPLAGLATHAIGGAWVHTILTLLVASATVLVLTPAVQAALLDAEGILQRLSFEGVVSAGLSELHRHFGTPFRVIDVTTAAVSAAILASGGRVPWLATAYGFAAGVTLLLKTAAALRLRRTRPGAPYQAPFNIRIGGRSRASGAIVLCALLAVTMATTIGVGTPAAVVTAVAIAVLFFVLRPARPQPTAASDDPTADTFDVLRASVTAAGQLSVQPGGLLVPVRNPHALDHLTAALRAAGTRDVVVMTVRMTDVEGNESTADLSVPTPYEQRLFLEVTTIAERLERPVHLLIVPSRSVVDAIVATVLQLRASEIFVGESATLSVADQTRMIGDAWERADKPEPHDVRVVITHRSGRSDIYHLGAHPPSLTPADVDLIHRIWLDAVKTVGPHVHHRDVVRAALTQMEQQLTGPGRDEGLAAIREMAKPAEELAAILRTHDYARLRDLLRNRHASDVAELLTALSVEDQAVVFRVLPRKDAAAVFEYLSQESKETLLKGMAQEDVASLLNNMAPDDRTMFLEELPATATRQLLTLLTPRERSVALTLLGYPEGSVGRLMTPHYVAVREAWTVQEVLDYVRTHGHDSETLNVIYVVDEQGVLIDDIRIREFLLAPLDKRVVDLMDRRFVALTAPDDQQAAVAIFRQYDRSALPVTDTTGMLIGIVTIDDVLDVAEATATREIQRIGGSEALDEPYMKIALPSMIRKRAGWLVALFLGETLTATAMGFFQHEIERAVVLAMFVPLIISSGGNSGSQASTLVIRALALGEVSMADWWSIMRREVFAGLALGAILGTIGFFRITVWSAFSDMYGEHWLLVAVTVALSLVGVVLWGTLSGSLLPILLRRLGFDPAVSSAPFVATLVDVTGLVIYFSVALVTLRGTLLKPAESAAHHPTPGHYAVVYVPDEPVASLEGSRQR